MSGQNTAVDGRASWWPIITSLVIGVLVLGCGSPGATPTPTTGAATPVPTLVSPVPSASQSLAPTPTAPPTPLPTAPPTQAPTPSPTTEAPTPTASPTAQPTATASAAPAGLVELIAGGGTADPGDGGPATAARLVRPAGIAVSPDGSIWFVDSNTATVRVVGTDGIIRTAARDLYNPVGIAIANDGTVYVADSGNYRVVSVADNGRVVVLTGSSLHPGFRGDGGPARRAYLFQPYDVAVDDAGNVYIADSGNNRIRLVDIDSGIIDTIAGDGTAAFGGDDGPATLAELQRPSSIVVDPAGSRLYIADTRNSRIRMVDLVTDTITTIAGAENLAATSYVPGGTGLLTQMNHLNTIAVDHDGNVYVVVFYTDLGNIVMRIAPSGEMTRVVGGGRSIAAGVAPNDFALSDITALEIDRASGSLLMTSADGKVYRVPGVATPEVP